MQLVAVWELRDTKEIRFIFPSFFFHMQDWTGRAPDSGRQKRLDGEWSVGSGGNSEGEQRAGHQRQTERSSVS